jgi:hypothetical protein
MSRARTTASRHGYQRSGAAVAVMLGTTSDRVAHEMDRHPNGIPEPGAEAEGGGGKVESLLAAEGLLVAGMARDFPRPHRPSQERAGA